MNAIWQWAHENKDALDLLSVALAVLTAGVAVWVAAMTYYMQLMHARAEARGELWGWTKVQRHEYDFEDASRVARLQLRDLASLPLSGVYTGSAISRQVRKAAMAQPKDSAILRLPTPSLQDAMYRDAAGFSGRQITDGLPRVLVILAEVADGVERRMVRHVLLSEDELAAYLHDPARFTTERGKENQAPRLAAVHEVARQYAGARHEGPLIIDQNGYVIGHRVHPVHATRKLALDGALSGRPSSRAA